MSAHGLHDMAGNVWEWCRDWYASDYYHHSPAIDPRGPTKGVQKVLRGGSFMSSHSAIRCSFRHKDVPTLALPGYGFRVAVDDTPLGLPIDNKLMEDF